MDGDQGSGDVGTGARGPARGAGGAVGGPGRVGPVRVGPGDVGARVVVRHLLPGGSASDALGELLVWRADLVRVRRAGGEVVDVAPGAVVAARVVPPATPRRAPRPPSGSPGPGPVVPGEAASRPAPVEDVVRAAAATWPARVTAHLGDWELRASPGRPSRGWSAVAVGRPDRGLDDALEAVRMFAAAHARPAAITVASAAPGRTADDAGRAQDLEAVLAARGWRPGGWTVVATAPVVAGGGTGGGRDGGRDGGPGGAALGPATGSGGGVVVEVSAVPDASWWAASERDGGPLVPDDLPPVDAATRFLTARGTAGASGSGGGPVVGVARVATAVVAGRTWAVLSCVHVLPGARRRGVGAALAGAAARAAPRDPAPGAGAPVTALVQVLEANGPARALWRSQGFGDHHRYRTWVAPG